MTPRRPWPPADETRAILERLSYWHTLDEIAVLLGRTRGAVQHKTIALRVPMLWREWNGVRSRRWFRGERMALLNAAGTTSQRQAASDLGRSIKAVQSDARRIGIPWRQGVVSVAQIAREVGCGRTKAQKTARRLFATKGPRYGTAEGARYRLDDEQADALRAALGGGK